ncbi:helix-turn-helix domain-containing protein [Halomonas aquamarina]|uniref:Helix-turn-helix domain-containing protein n=1 Tax=Vreelandella aquamarina TaxID=77097 RepID=A0ACC5VS27_9GAMM|nr:helix-turn-helix domain-containing protein [Halomonas aquamarina]
MKALVTYAEAAEMLSVSHWTVRQMVREGRLNATGEGKGRRVTMGSIRRIGELDADALDVESHSAPGVQNGKGFVCHIKEPVRLTGGHRTTTQAANELDALLGQRT